VSILVYGTPQIYALAAKLTEDRIPGTSPASAAPPQPTGRAILHLPYRRTYWSQGTAAVDFVKKQFGGNLKGKKIAYISMTTAGREPIEVLETSRRGRLPAQMFAVPPPASRWAPRCSTSPSASARTP